MARSFNGSSDNVNWGTGATVDLTTYTATAWIKFTSNFTAERIVLGKTVSPSFNAKQYLQTWGVNQNDFASFLSREAGHCYSRSATGTLSSGVWNFVAASADGSTAPKLYVAVHGSLASEVSYAEQTFGSGAFLNTSSANLRTGSRDPADAYWSGEIAEVRLYNEALNLSEIRAVQYGLMPRHSALAFWAPHWGTHSTEIDLSPNRKTGTVSGTTAVSHPPVSLFTPSIKYTSALVREKRWIFGPR